MTDTGTLPYLTLRMGIFNTNAKAISVGQSHIADAYIGYQTSLWFS